MSARVPESGMYPTFPLEQMVGTHDIVWIVLDSVRFDVAQGAHERGETPNLSLLFGQGWECRHAPGTFTLPSHVAMFSGFFPTPHDMPTAAKIASPRIPGGVGLGENTFLFDEASIPHAFAARGYRTVCIGGVGFFSNYVPLATILPSYFEETFWKPRYGPGRKESVGLQVEKAREILLETTAPVFLFINVATTHHPTAIYVDGATKESVETQAASLRYADAALGPLLALLAERRSTRPTILIVCSDHGDAFGEDGYWGHRLSHPTVLEIPYAHVVLDDTFVPTISAS
jgi:arylsulfatase A-like enzyme